MKSLALAVAVALTTFSGAVNATPIDTSSLSVHGNFGGNDYGR